MEQKLKQQLGEMLFTILVLQHQLGELRQQAPLAKKKENNVTSV